MPNLHIVSPEEMLEHFNNQTFQQKLSECRKIAVEQEKTAEDLMHEIFCCKKEIYRYIHPDGENEIALISEYTNHEGVASKVISRLQDGDDLYELRLP